MREELPISEKILQTLHNLCATAPDLARRSEELAQVMQLDLTEVERILCQFFALHRIHMAAQDLDNQCFLSPFQRRFQ